MSRLLSVPAFVASLVDLAESCGGSVSWASVGGEPPVFVAVFPRERRWVFLRALFLLRVLAAASVSREVILRPEVVLVRWSLVGDRGEGV